MLQRHFEKRDLKGKEKVRKKQYALEDHCSGRDLDRSRPLAQWLRRGMKVNMSMVFRVTKQGLTGSQCPRCHTTVVATEGRTVQCKTAQCGMWFRISESQYVEEKDDQDDDQNASSMRAVLRDGNGRGKTTNEAASRKIHAADCKPVDFQRVRLLTVPPTPHKDDVFNNLQAFGIFHSAGHRRWSLSAYIYDTNGPADRFVQPYPESQADRAARLRQETEALQRRRGEVYLTSQN
ncbi:hypothetical protein GGTG_13432 [Gaeumannomyces tritici R3-111a-1]|uniref:Uncharacterized protein n=1 Tax=Gaeumannomyces tritici (strain R3-111a-1) TaxID=644352 RepID=J3PIV2_GAET3|nr:hypothetical protein GGTG_13432 [Gaeumannomyces tritici R3-111a-1]EJT69035.1 hypothetical protein GGTG_13432 [Gaeumannomyces tritici R3-111a-1]